MVKLGIAIAGIVGTVVSYIIGRKLFEKYKTPLLLPITVALIIIVLVLSLAKISYETYMIGGKWIHFFLGPAVVALAYPLYEQRHLLKQLAFPILVGSFVGSIIGVLTGFFFAKLANLEDVLLYSLLPKSVTTPVAMEISQSLGGISSLAAVLVIIAGLTGALFGPFLFRLFRIRNEVARGVGFGSASHAIGTGQAFERSEIEGSSSTIAMIVSAVFVSLLTPLLIKIL